MKKVRSLFETQHTTEMGTHVYTQSKWNHQDFQNKWPKCSKRSSQQTLIVQTESVPLLSQDDYQLDWANQDYINYIFNKNTHGQNFSDNIHVLSNMRVQSMIYNREEYIVLNPCVKDPHSIPETLREKRIEVEDVDNDSISSFGDDIELNELVMSIIAE